MYEIIRNKTVINVDVKYEKKMSYILIIGIIILYQKRIIITLEAYEKTANKAFSFHKLKIIVQKLQIECNRDTPIPASCTKLLCIFVSFSDGISLGRVRQFYMKYAEGRAVVRTANLVAS